MIALPLSKISDRSSSNRLGALYATTSLTGPVAMLTAMMVASILISFSARTSGSDLHFSSLASSDAVTSKSLFQSILDQWDHPARRAHHVEFRTGSFFGGVVGGDLFDDCRRWFGWDWDSTGFLGEGLEPGGAKGVLPVFVFFGAFSLTMAAYDSFIALLDGCRVSVSIALGASFEGLAVTFATSGLRCAGRCTGFLVAALAGLGGWIRTSLLFTYGDLEQAFYFAVCGPWHRAHLAGVSLWASCTRRPGAVLRT
ncbi:hypothetical protein Trydic_g18791 [Trypoxylus dichotomus]